MHRTQLKQDIQPLSVFLSKAASYLKKVNKNKHTLIITQNGKSTAVLLGVSEYARMLDKIEMLEEVILAESQIKKGLAVKHSEVKKRYSK